ncbi:MAG: transcriptional regulator protein [Gemmatimonadetes bacterium]|nr:transcriptional regulator protein [Gemmatimonadota bacterium]
MSRPAEPPATETILIVDDEPQIRRVLRNALEPLFARVVEAATASAAIDMAAAERPGLVILDLGLPDRPGVEVCGEIRQWSTVPILVLSARHADHEKVGLLDAGADDYLTKPFSTSELVARVRALLRRAHVAPVGGATQVIEMDGLTIDLAKPMAKRDGITIHLTKTEWDVLRTMLRHAGRTLTHQQLFRAVWGNSFGDMQQYLRVHVRSLRRKLERDPVRPQLIRTEPGVGYRFETDP